MSLLRHGRVVLVLAGLLSAILPATVQAQDPPPATPIKHFIVMMQENHSFDNYFGQYPGVSLFSLAPGAADLEPGPVPNALHQAFRQHHRPLTAQARVEAGPAPEQWMVVDGNVKYAIKAENQALNVYSAADGIPPEECMEIDPKKPDPDSCIRPFHLDSTVLRTPPDPRRTFDLQYRGGEVDGFIDAFKKQGRDLRTAQTVMGYYTDAEVPFYWNLADQYVLFDNFFSSGNGGSVQNHLYWVAAAPGADDEQIPPEGWGDLPTIFDRLEAKNISWKFYVEDYDTTMNFRTPAGVGRTSQIVRAPLLAFARFVDTPELAGRIVDLSTYYDDLRKGTLPAVAYIVSAGASEQPPSPLHPGQRLVKNLLNALMKSTAWNNSAFVLSYDRAGGWYDHVKPPQVDAHGLGFRVPALLVSPYARQGHINSTPLDFTSLLRFIEDNYDLQPLTERDKNANSIVSAFDFQQPPRAPEIVPTARPTPPKPEPRRAAIYGAYSGALIVAGLIVAWAKLRTRRPRQRTLPPGPRLPQDDAA